MGFEDGIYLTDKEWMTYQDEIKIVRISAHAFHLTTQENVLLDLSPKLD